MPARSNSLSPSGRPARRRGAHGLPRGLLGLGRGLGLALALLVAVPISTQAQTRQQPGKTAATASLNQAQREMLSGINQTFNAIRTLYGKFTQFGPDGARTDGEFFLERPGKIRFIYQRPSTLDIIADGRDVVVRDRKLATHDLFPLSQTPLRFLLADKIDLTSEANVQQVSIEPDLVTVVVSQETMFGDGKLTLLFDRPNQDLKQWIVTDAQGLDTTVVIFDTTQNKGIDPKTFVIPPQLK